MGRLNNLHELGLIRWGVLLLAHPALLLLLLLVAAPPSLALGRGCHLHELPHPFPIEDAIPRIPARVGDRDHLKATPRVMFGIYARHAVVHLRLHHE